MKLRNKKTGEVVDLSEGFMHDVYCGEKIEIKPVAISNKEGYVYGSLAELNEEWEDYEEQEKRHYYIEPRGQVIELEFGDDIDELREELLEIGNYFETEEEAEKAVEKLKAWKRLKDAGFKITGWANSIGDDYYKPSQIVIEMDNKPSFDEYDDIEPFRKDLNLLFGSEDS